MNKAPATTLSSIKTIYQSNINHQQAHHAGSVAKGKKNVQVFGSGPGSFINQRQVD